MTVVPTDLLARARKLRRDGALDEAAKLCREVLGHQPKDFDALRELGALCLMQRRPQEALSLLEAALRLKPQDFDALFARANTLVAMKRYSEALSGFEAALKIRPKSAEAHNNRGGALGMLRRHAEALDSFEKAIQCKPDHFDAHNNRGNALKALGRREEALDSYDKALELNPKMAGALYSRGVLLAALDRHEEAISSFDRLLEIQADSAQAHYSRANSLKALNRHDDAVASYDQALTINPRHAEALNNRGTSLQVMNRGLDAIASLQQALAIKPNSTGVLSNLGNALSALDRHEEAIASYDRALAIKPQNAEALSNRGATLAALNRYEEAIASYQQAIAIKPDYAQAHFNEAFARLALGELPAGWEKYEWRWEVKNFPSPKRNYKQPRWPGSEPLAGKTILLHAEQGFGDAIQFLRYVPLVACKGGRVLLGVPSPLASLGQGLEGVANVTTQSVPREDFDLHCPLLSLPLAFGTTLGTIPSSVPYLKAPPERVSHWANQLGAKNRFRIGLTWSGNPRHKNDRNRSIPLTLLAPLFSLSAEFVCIQTELRDSDRQDLARHPEIRHFGKEIRDFADTAALIELLDLVISVDTATAHLAGALGTPVWILLPFAPDWRWLLDREDSPWYPTARLFRQPAPGDWKSVIDRARSELVSTVARSPNEGVTASVGLPGLTRLTTAHEEKPLSNVPDRLSGAVALLKQIRLAEAELLFRSILAEHPNHFDALHLLGVCVGRLGKHDEAYALINEALKTNPRSAEALSNRGSALRNLNRYDEAIASFEQALAIQPDHTEALNNRGAALHALNRYVEAITSYEQALVIKPDYAEALKNRGAALQALNRHQEAIASYQRAVAIKPDYAEAHANEALARLVLGDFAAGREKYEWRTRSADWEPRQGKVDRPVWSGSSLDGQVLLIRGEQGLGDQIMFASCLPEIIARAKLCVVEVEPRLAKLFSRSFPSARIYGLFQKGVPGWTADRIEADWQVQIGSLPHRLGRDLHNFPKHQGYLVPDPARVLAWRSRLDQLGPGPKVGISWRGGTPKTRQATRSVPLSQWAPLLKQQAHWVSLQYGECQAEIEAVARAEGVTVHHWRDAIDDYDETAALVAALDLVVSVQTSIVHLAGALGKIVWVIVPATPEWRYLAHGETLPWYPTARLFRQPAPGDWTSVIERVRSELVSTFKGAFHKGAIASAGVPRLAQLTSPHEGNLPPNASATLNRAVALLHQGNLAGAERLFRSVLAANPSHFDALHILGVCEGRQGKHDEAYAHINEALKINPRSAEALKNRGLALAAQNRHQEALVSYEQALAIKSDFADALYDQGNALNALKRHREALASFDRALAIKPDFAESLNNRGNTLNALNRHEEALASYERALAIRPDYAEALSNRGNILNTLNRHDEALASFERALAIKPDYVEALNNCGIALKELNRHAEAIVSYDQALAIKSDYVPALNNRGNSLRALNRDDEALASFDQALAIRPDYPEAHWNKSLALLTIGDLKQGWQEYEWRWKRPGISRRPRDFKKPEWLGQSSLVGKTILLWAEQGIGDTIQFVRYAPLVASKGCRVLLLVSQPVAPLVKRLEGVARVTTQQVPREDFDVHCPLLSVPLAFGTTLDTIPSDVPYLNAPSERLSHWSARLGPPKGARVGLCWSGKATHTNDRNRSIALPKLLPLTSLGLEFVSLQKEVRREDQATLVESGQIRHFGEELRDFADTAALASLMDVVISVDTATAHLAGALAKPVWVLLPFSPDWRWLLNREDSPWYPTARLFRQPAPGDWKSVIERVRSELVSTFKGAFHKGAIASAGVPRLAHLTSPHQANPPSNASAMLNRAVALLQKGRLAEAERLFRSILAAHPNHFDALHLLGVCNGKQGKHEEAYAFINEALKINPRSAEALKNRGFALAAQKRHQEALASYEQALAIKPDFADALYDHGNALNALNRHREALASFDRALLIEPNHVGLLNNRGNVLIALNRYEEALASFDHALTIKPDHVEALVNRGAALNALNQHEQALASYDQALTISPDHVLALNNRGDTLNSLSRHEDAQASFERALVIDPAYAGAHWNRSLSLLTIGHFKQGWQEYDWRMYCGNWESHQLKVDRPVWSGSSLDGQVLLIRGEQGLGDQIMFASCLPEIIARAKLCVVEVEPRLAKLFARSFPTTRIYSLWQRGAPGWRADNLEFDWQVQIGSLPHRLGRDLHNFPKHQGYLVADPARVLAWRSRLDELGAGPKVGISWRGGSPKTRQATRSVPLSQWAPLLKQRAHWVSLQYGECQAEIEAVARVEGVTVHHWREAIDDYDETAALVGALDLVVSVQTSIVHLAGAMGKAVWVIVPATPEWRYLAHGETLPWYPTARLFRQPAPGAWESVIERVRSELVSTFKETFHESAIASAGVPRPAQLTSPHEGNLPPNASATLNRAVALFQADKLEDTEDALRSLLVEHPQHFDSLHLLGVCRGRQGKHYEAYALISEALQIKPRSAEALSNRGNALRALNRHEEAIASCDQALAIEPDHAEALNNRGAVLQALNRYEEAIASYEQALTIKPDYAEALKNRGTAFQALNRYQDAISNYERAVSVKPDFAESHFSEGIARLTLGELPAAWEKYEWRWKMKDFTSPKRNFKQPLWLGKESLEGKTILLHAEQGLGDAIQFVRYVPAVVQRGGRVFVEAPALLRRLLEGLAGIERVIAKGEALPEFDLHCPLLSLPLAFRTTLDTIPADIPYLKAPAQRLSHWGHRLGPRKRPRVGLTWSGRAEHKNDRNRSIALARLLPLTSLGLEFVSLQKDAREADREALIANPEIRSFASELKDFADTAALVSLMDLVVSVDTATVHLAGALGRPVWVLLPWAPDWRWLLDRDDSPWYPTARLFRQPTLGDWESVIRRVAEELRKRFVVGDSGKKEIREA